jgi:hypothetical protein
VYPFNACTVERGFGDDSPDGPNPPGNLGPKVAIRKDNIMSRRENDANNMSRPSDSPLTEYEKEQVALRRNLKRLKAERLAREAANSKDD